VSGWLVNGMQGVRGSNPLSSTTAQSHQPAPFGVGLDSPIPDSSGEISERGRDLLGHDQPLAIGAIPQVPATFATGVTRFLAPIRRQARVALPRAGTLHGQRCACPRH
jgi:hypothetical protein